MSNKTFLRLWLVSISGIITGALLFAGRGLLPAIFITILRVALAVLLVLAVYYIHKLYVAARTRHVDLAIKQEELRLLQAGVHHQEILSHIALTRIYPDNHGYLPVLANDNMRLAPGQMDLLMLPQMSQTKRSYMPSEEPEEGEQDLPMQVRYEDIQAQIPKGHALLGVSQQGVETCDFSKLMTMWICGGSSTGKSNTVALKIDEAVRNGRDLKILCIDPHARKEDSLYNKIRCYEHRFVAPVAVSEDDILKMLQWFYREFQQRLTVGGADTDILLVVDEVSNVVDSENEQIGKLVKKIARICGQESRGFGMFGWFISQRAAGLAWLRNIALTVIAHKMVMMSERKLACNEDLQIARSMDQWPRGRVVVYGVEFEPQVYQMALFSPARSTIIDAMPALEDLPKSFQRQQVEDVGRLSEDTQEAIGREMDTDPVAASVVLKNFFREARKKREDGASIDQILKEAGLPAGGYRNQELKTILNGLGQE